MKNIGRLFLGLLTALTSSLLVISAVSLSLLEGKFQATPQPAASTLPENQPTQPEVELSMQPTPTLVRLTPTLVCTVPEGWKPYMISPGDTLESLAQEWGTTSDILYQMNCLPSPSLAAGYILYHPPQPTPTVTFTMTVEPSPEDTATAAPTATAIRPLCGPPPGWIFYTVRPGDTLYRIATAYGITVEQLKFANCLAGDIIRVGQRLYVPNVSPHFPTVTQTPTEKSP